MKTVLILPRIYGLQVLDNISELEAEGAQVVAVAQRSRDLSSGCSDMGTVLLR